MYIYRLENKNNKQGAYREHSGISKEDQELYQYGSAHPTPRSDGIDIYDIPCHEDLIFGFNSIAQARRWWHNEVHCKRWNRNGVRLMVCYQRDCKRIFKGKHQVAFERPERYVYLNLEHLHGMGKVNLNKLAAKKLAKVKIEPKTVEASTFHLRPRPSSWPPMKPLNPPTQWWQTIINQGSD